MDFEYKLYKPKNNYMFRIQELYKYQHLLQEITKELNKYEIYIFTQLSGIISGVEIFALSHFLGAHIILCLFLLNQAPHQLKVLLAIIKCLQLLIKCKSLIDDFVSIKINFSLLKKKKVFLTKSISSEKIKKKGFFTLFFK